MQAFRFGFIFCLRRLKPFFEKKGFRIPKNFMGRLKVAYRNAFFKSIWKTGKFKLHLM